jgi:hypothetical protein
LLSVIMLSVFMLNVMAPIVQHSFSALKKFTKQILSKDCNI